MGIRKVSLLSSRKCPSCGSEIPMKDIFKFMLTFKYYCRSCGSESSISIISKVLVAVTGVVFARAVEYLFGLDFIFSLLIACFLVSFVSVLIFPLKIVRMGAD